MILFQPFFNIENYHYEVVMKTKKMHLDFDIYVVNFVHMINLVTLTSIWFLSFLILNQYVNQH